jgi:predicted MFS family arabinose efflux permease
MATVLTTRPAVAPPARARTSRVFPWAVFALTFALLLSDYMSRQVLSAVFPYLKQEWGLSNTKLGSLTSIVALTVGILAVPLSVLGDRWGRVKAVVTMAALWSVATAASAVATNYDQLLLARMFIGVGEAAYGSVGLAIVLSVFPRSRRASLTGAFMAGGSFGAVIGVYLGGSLAQRFGWRWSFGAMALVGFALVALYRVVVNDAKLAAHRHPETDVTPKAPVHQAKLRTLFSTPAVLCAYVGSGLQLFVVGTLISWLPMFLFKTYKVRPDKAAAMAAIFLLIMGVGMILCGLVTDRVSRHVPVRKWTTAIVYSAVSLAALGYAFSADRGTAQLVALGIGVFFVAGVAGPAGSMVANLTHESIRASALGTLTMANSLLGLAAGPFVTGILADRLGGLGEALKVVPFVSIAAILALVAGRFAYPSSLRKVSAA